MRSIDLTSFSGHQPGGKSKQDDQPDDEAISRATYL